MSRAFQMKARTSMDYEAMYDDLIADTYDEDTFDILGTSHELALEQILRHLPSRPISAVCDVAVGTGRFLDVIRRHLPEAGLTGLDISNRMLELARRRVPGMETLQADATAASRSVPPASVGLSIAHFVMSYLDPRKLVRELYAITAPGGLCSVVNSTYQTFGAMQRMALRFMTENELRAISDMPLDEEGLRALVTGAGFQVLESASLRLPVHFDSFEHLRGWGVRSGFLTTFFEALTPEQIAVISRADGLFPVDDHFEGAFVLSHR